MGDYTKVVILGITMVVNILKIIVQFKGKKGR